MDRNKQFATKCSRELLIEEKRQEQWITPFLNSLGYKWKYCKIHSKNQTHLKIDGWINGVLFECKCISRDQPNFFAEMWINRGTHIENGWMTKPLHKIVDRHPIYMFVAMETKFMVYDYKAVKEFVNSLDLQGLKKIGGWEWRGEDPSLGGEITGWNIPLTFMQKFEVKDFKKCLENK